MTAKKLLTSAALLAATIATASADITIYSNRQDFLLQPLVTAFEQETGIEVTTLFVKSGLVERIQTEGQLTDADLMIATDISRMEAGRNAGIFASLPADLPGLNRVPSNLRQADGQWVALTQRARVAYVPADSDIDALSYQDVATATFDDGLCIRNAQHVYNVGLVAGYLSNYGEAETLAWLEGLKSNLARSPDGNDRAQIRGIGAGECSVALSNSYYYGIMLSDPDQKPQADAAKLIFPTFGTGENSRGTHVNISGIGLVANSDAVDEAQQFISFMLGDAAQAIYAEVNHEYPVVPTVAPSDLVASWGTPTFDTLDLTTMASNWVAASELIDDVNLNR